MPETTTATQPYIDFAPSTLTPMYQKAGCPWCNGVGSITVHGGLCPKIKAIEYHPSGAVKRVEFKDG